MKKENLCKNPRKIGEISRHQWGVVVDRGGQQSTQVAGQYKSPCLVVRQWKRK